MPPSLPGHNPSMQFINEPDFVPQNSSLAFSAERISARVSEMANEMRPWVEQHAAAGSPIIAAAILRGGIFFYVDLVRALAAPHLMGYIRARAYEEHTARSEVNIDLAGLEDFKNRAVLLVDEICDSGRTLATAASTIKAAGAAEVKTAVLLRRLIAQPEYRPDHTGFEVDGDSWFVGYGMQRDGIFRNLREIYALRNLS